MNAKLFSVVAILGLLAAPALAVQSPIVKPVTEATIQVREAGTPFVLQSRTVQLETLNGLKAKFTNLRNNPNVGLDLCPTCISFVEQSIDNLIQIIANGGIAGGCAALCGMLPNPTVGKICDLLCDIVGIETFIKILGKVDLDPFYACELLTVCHTTTGGAANFTDFKVNPNPAYRNSQVDFTAELQVTNATGCGELIFAVQDPEGNVIGTGQTFGGLAPNVYNIDFQAKTTPGQQQGSEQWPPGKYVAELAVCQGECGSKHPHSEVYDVATVKFDLES